MSTQTEITLETEAMTLIDEACINLPPSYFSNVPVIITFVAIIATNGANIEGMNFNTLTVNVQEQIVTDLLPIVVAKLQQHNLLKPSVLSEINALIADATSLHNVIVTAIQLYDLTVVVTKLPSFNSVEKSSLSSLSKSLPKGFPHFKL